jgi:hypothetical protein
MQLLQRDNAPMIATSPTRDANYGEGANGMGVSAFAHDFAAPLLRGGCGAIEQGSNRGAVGVRLRSRCA